jgi:hypothetical protein
MRKPKTRVIVKLERLTMESRWGIPYLGQVGTVVGIEKGAFTEYLLRVKFNDAIDMIAFDEVLEDGFSTDTSEVSVIEGNLNIAYYGEYKPEY